MLDEQSELRWSPISLTDADIERRKAIVELAGDDLSRIAGLRDLIEEHVDRYTDSFFRHLHALGEAPALFGKRSVLDEARRRKREHLMALTSAEYDRPYVEQRIALALLYSQYGVSIRVFLGAFNHLLHAIGSDLMKRGKDSNDSFQSLLSLKKVAFFDIGVMTDVLTSERERTISQQQDAIRELSTPVLQVRDGLLILPIIGTIDSQRAKQLTDGLLRAIRANRARLVVMDITGVAAVDSKVANHLIQTVAAARLMGSTVLITGLSADVAQALVALGVDLGKINTMADLQSGLEEAERMLGYRIVRSTDAAGQRPSA
jgi:rsbT co-antagonist protein RsbR